MHELTDIDLIVDDLEEFPPYTGTEFLAKHDTIDSHDYPLAFGQFLSLGLHPDVANLLAFGQNRFDLISPDLDNPLRQKAFEIFDRLCEMSYWDEE